MSEIVKLYKDLFEKSKKIHLLRSVESLLSWDQETYMPGGAAAARSEQLELMASLAHEEQTSKEFQKALEKLIDLDTGKVLGTDLNPLQKAALREWRRDFLLAVKLPNSFVKAFAKLTSESLVAWQTAKKTNDFPLFAPNLQKIVEMCQQKADYLGFKDDPYDALLDYYEPELTTKEVDKLFKNLKVQIVALLTKIRAKKQVDDSFLFGKFNENKQLKFGKEILSAVGYDLNKGRLDISSHPFSSAFHPTDSRITTRFEKNAFFGCISAILHEAGHGLYEMGLLSEHYGSPLGEAISLGIHESQSRFWETCIGQSRPFWKHFLPLLKKHFKGPLEKVSLEKFYKGINKVFPTFIRVDADEVTYSLHVILRFEIEQMLINGTCAVADLPGIWNEKMEELLGVSPPTDREGCLQDIHWSMGAFGYFPTYTLGNLYASFFFEAFEKEHPDWAKRVEQGELLFIRDWLIDNVHRHGRSLSAKELAKKIGKRELSSAPYVNYLNNKYKEIYSFS